MTKQGAFLAVHRQMKCSCVFLYVFGSFRVVGYLCSAETLILELFRLGYFLRQKVKLQKC